MLLRLNIFILALLFLGTIQTQAQVFKAGVILGVNAAQIDGDLIRGYKKYGVEGGLRGVVAVAKKFELSTELLFSQRGSYQPPANKTESAIGLHLDYIAVPILLNFLRGAKGERKKDRYYRYHINAGFAYGRLINTRIDQIVNDNTELVFQEVAQEFNKDDFSFCIGIAYYINKHWGLNFRHTFSANPLFNKRKTQLENIKYPLRGYFFSLQAIYMI